ncbi:MAG TPA: hypothetical protein VLF60_03040 [Candidatus Saccharimonadales bacterium]|nr:hypothetical protein [Candidatus Saccharimonadales bacterium]
MRILVLGSLGLTGWEKWSYLATILSVLVNGVFLFFLIKQVRQGQAAQKAAERSADAANNSVKEALYARIDQQAPRVVALLDQPTIGGVQSESKIAWGADQEAVLPRDKEKYLYVGVTGTLINEGKGTARVHLNGAAEWILDEEDEPLLMGPITPSQDDHILRPGQQVRFLWSEAHSLEDWADAYSNPSPANPRGACFMDVIVHDYFEEGVIDHIFLEMSGRPLVPVVGDSSHWKIPDKAEFAAISYPIKRAHLCENNHKITPSWVETYKEWDELHGS